MRINLFRSLLLALAIFAVSAASSAQISISVNFGPPALPVYDQPLCPGPDYIWTPGYWAWSNAGADYFWVPGTWVLAPDPGLLWTPGYWAFENSVYLWHPGYWGPTVGYYGGIDYGFGYTGAGYYGGYWRDNHFFYNQAVNRIDAARIHDVYRGAVPAAPAASRVSFNGGPGGTTARPTPQQEAAAREHHVAATAVQMQNEHAAGSDRQLMAKVNQGRPPVAATAKPANFSGGGVVSASRAGAPYKPPENRAAPEKRPAPRPNAAAPAPNRAPARNERTEAAPKTSRATPPPARTPQPEREVRPNNSRPAPERAPQPEKQVRPEKAPRQQTPPPNAANRPVPRPAERAPQARPEKAPEARPEKAAPAPKPEARPAEKKPEEEEHPR